MNREHCIVCGKKIHRSKSTHGRKRRRATWSVTCSHKCSREYNDNPEKYEELKNGEILKN